MLFLGFDIYVFGEAEWLSINFGSRTSQAI